MKVLHRSDLLSMLRIVTDTVIANEKRFCDLDAAIGDGDFGTSLAMGFRVIVDEIAWDNADSSVGEIMVSMGMTLMEHCGGASGPLWGNAFLRMGKIVANADTLDLDAMAAVCCAAVDAIQHIGGAEAGDKTILDALIPVYNSFNDSLAKNEPVEKAFCIASQMAEQGAESTRNMVAAIGRASYLGKRSLGSVDPGAASVAIIMQAIVEQMHFCSP